MENRGVWLLRPQEIAMVTEFHGKAGWLRMHYLRR